MLALNVYCTGRTAHLSMPVTGLLMLEEQGKVRLSFEIDRSNRRQFPYAPLLGVYGEGKRLLFDLADGYGSEVEGALPRLAEEADLVFRRSLSPAETAKLPPQLQGRLRPLGLHYHVSYPGNPIDRISSWRERGGDLFQRAFNGAPRSYFTPDKFECPPAFSRRPTALFYTRLWHMPEGSELYESVERLNRDRIRLVSELRARYGPRFVGGLQFDPREARRWGKLMVGVGETRRTRYLRAMRGAHICVGSAGLHDSIGWKTAEYVAAAKAVVSERFCFEVPGGFREESNYLPFTSVEGCLEQVERLMNDPQRTYEMAKANRAYYLSHLRPDRLMANALVQAFPDWERGAAEE